MLRNPGLRKSVEQPVLDLNFAASQIGSNAAPDSRIDFSRGSNAYFVDSDGLVKKSPHNLQVYSQDFDNAAWSKARVTVSANATTAPDGTLTADKIVETAESGAKYWRDFASAVAGERFFFSVFAKAAERKYLQMWTAFGTGGNWPQVWNVFDVEAGTVIRSDPDGDSATIEDVGNGWFRCTTSITADGTGLDDIGFGLWDGSGTVPTTSHSYVGDGSSGLFLWGAQFSHHSTAPVDNPYIKTDSSAVYAARLDHDPTWFMSAAQEQNLFTNSEMLNETGSTGWTPVRTVVTEDSTEDPNGNTTAEKVLEDSTASSSHFVRSPDFTTTAGKSYTASAYVKVAAGTDRLFRIAFSGVDSAFGYFYAQFDLQSGSLDFSVADDSSITDVGNGWFRLSVTKTASATADTAEVQLTFVQKGGSASYDGDGTSGFFVWGAQIEVGTSPGTYHRTEGAPYYGEGATPKGLLIEEARTNLITDSESHTYLNGDILVAQTGNAGLAPDGTNTAIAFMETAGTGNHVSRRTGITIADNGNIIFSFFVKANGRTLGGIEIFGTGTGGAFAVFDLSTGQFGSSNAYSGATNLSFSLEDYGNDWFRVTLGITTASGGTSAIVQIRLYSPAGTNEYAGDATKGFLIWGMQLEQGNFPTSYIKTTGSTATRNADVATMGPTTGGTELVTNGTYDTDTSGWSNSRSTLSVVSGKLRVTSTGGNYPMAFQDLTTVIGRRYRVTADITFGTTAGAVVQINSETGQSFTTSGGVLTSSGSVSFDFTANITNTQIILHGNTGTSAGQYQEFDNVSVRELYPFEQYNPAEGTVVCEFERHDNTAFDFIWDFGFGTNNENTFALLHLDATRVYHSVKTANAQQITYSPTTVEPGDKGINAFAYQTNNVNSSFSRNGSFTHSFNDSSYSIPPADKMAIGSRKTEIAQHNGYIKRLTYYPYRLNDAVCDSKVTS